MVSFILLLRLKGIRIPFSMVFESICFGVFNYNFFFLCLVVKFERLVLVGVRLVGLTKENYVCSVPLGPIA